jgi:hypothetical protein
MIINNAKRPTREITINASDLPLPLQARLPSLPASKTLPALNPQIPQIPPTPLLRPLRDLNHALAKSPRPPILHGKG